MRTSVKTVAAYLKAFPPPERRILQTLRTTIRRAAPHATEVMRYGIPTFQVHGKNLVHFGGFKQHVSFFPGSVAMRVFAKALQPYRTSKGTVQFPWGVRIPYRLITRIVKYRLTENLAKVQ